MRTAHGIRFTPWDWNLALGDNVIVLCGEGCAAALLSRSLGEWKQSSISGLTDKPVAIAA